MAACVDRILDTEWSVVVMEGRPLGDCWSAEPPAAPALACVCRSNRARIFWSSARSDSSSASRLLTALTMRARSFGVTFETSFQHGWFGGASVRATISSAVTKTSGW